jgi:acyl-CoA thioesterase
LTAWFTSNNLGAVGTFSDDVTVVGIGNGRYRAVLDHSWDLVANPQGGVLASFGLRAATAEVDDPTQPLRTCTTVFAGQIVAGELDIDVQVLRRGRSATQVRTDVRNRGEAAGATTLAVFGSSRRGPTFVDVSPPAVPDPDQCPSFRDPAPPGFERAPTPFWDRLEGRGALGHPPWEHHEPTTSDSVCWYRFDDPPLLDDGSLDPLGIVTIADRMPGAVQEKLGRQGDRWFAPSADLTVHLFAPARTEWLMTHDRARWADDGWASAESTLWDEDRNLIAYATQVMLFTYLTS